MSRRIVFAGGTQTRALARLYRGEIAGRVGDDVTFIGSGGVGTDAAQSTLLLADLIVMEIDEDGDTVPGRLLPANAELIRLPNLYADFLWPFAGSPHPRNRGAFVLPGGPYPSEHGDRFLDRMVAEGVDEDAAIRRYLAIDIVAEGELESRLSDRLAIMERLDRAAGFDLAGYVAEHFRSQALFTTRQRPSLQMLRPLTAQLFGKMGVSGFDAAAMRRVPFPAGAQPLHPGVIAHFGLSYAHADRAYPFNDEGFFTFEAFCRRYMRFEWNEALHRGIQAARTSPAEAVEDLAAGLAACPDSMLGHQALEIARHLVGLEPGPAPDYLLDEDSYDPAALQLAQPAVAAMEARPPVLLVVDAPPPVREEPEWTSVDPDELEAEEAPAIGYAAILRRSAAAAAAARDPETIEHGFTRFEELEMPVKGLPALPLAQEATLIDVLPRLLPGFADFAAGAGSSPFSIMPETMPPPPLRPILPPELQGEPEKQGFFARLLGRRHD